MNVEELDYLVAYSYDSDETHAGGVKIKNSPENIANFIMKNQFSNCIITDPMDRFVVSSSIGGYIFKIIDQKYLLEKLHPAIIPIQLGKKEPSEVEIYEKGFEYVELNEFVFSDVDEIETYEYLIAYCYDEDGSYDFGKRIKNNEENIASFIVNNYEYNCVITDPSDRLVVSSIKGIIDESKSCMEYANKSLKLTCLAMLNDARMTPQTEFFEERQKVPL